MGTDIRPSISKKNIYWISRHRYYELKHFCLQYPVWKKAYMVFDGWKSPTLKMDGILNNLPGDPTAECAAIKAEYANKMNMVEQAAKEADSELSSYILKAVTEGISYTYLSTKLNIPCCKDTYYDRYRRFFWILNKKRD